MTIGSLSAILLGSLCLFLIVGFPVGFAILLSSLLALVVQSIPLKMAMMKMLAGVDNYLLTAIPFFILAGKSGLDFKYAYVDEFQENYPCRKYILFFVIH